MHAGAELGWGAAYALEGFSEVDVELLDVIGSTVGEARLGQAPHTFVGVEVGRVGGQRDQVQASEPAAHVTNGLSTMDRGVVPDDDHVTPEVPQQVTEEVAHPQTVDVRAVEAIVEAHAVPNRADREGRDDRDAVATVAVTQHRGATPRCPGLEQRGDQLEAALVREDDVGAQPLGVFFTSGHTSRFHRSMASSSRSRARRSGFWQLQPSECMRRPT